jgi:hypothetical protein
MSIFKILPVLMLLPGCASNAIRPTAVATLSVTQNFKAELTAFASRQNAEMASRRLSIATLDENSSLSEFQVRKHVMDWKATSREASLRVFEQAATDGPTSLPASGAVSGLLAPTPAGGVKLDAKAYDELITALKPLADKRSGAEDVEFILGFGSAVVEQMRKNVADAATEASTDKPEAVEVGGN